MGPLGGDCVQGGVRSPHPAASAMRLRGGRSLGGAGQGASHGADAASAQGVQLPLLRNVLDFATSLTASSNASSRPQIDRWLTHVHLTHVHRLTCTSPSHAFHNKSPQVLNHGVSLRAFVCVST